MLVLFIGRNEFCGILLEKMISVLIYLDIFKYLFLNIWLKKGLEIY